jgi:Alginate export
MKKIYFTLLVMGCAVALFAQNNPLSILRYNDNFSHLKSDTVQKKGFEKLKMIPLSKNRENGVYVSFGGEIREQVQHFENLNFGDVPPTFPASSATQLWHRVMLHGDLEVGKKVRFFTQINHTLRPFNPNPLGEIDENQLGLHQAFVEYHPTTPLSIRVGRQELGYGNNRMLTFREGPNNRLAFDAAIAKWKKGAWQVDALVVFPVFQSPKIGDDVSFKDRVMGIYATQTAVPQKAMIDYYVLHYKGNRVRYNLESGNELRTSIGARLFSRNPKFNYELEATYQTGSFNALNINALAIAYDVNYIISPKIKLTLGLAGNYITGDKNPTDNQLNTYNLLFSKPSFGLAAPIGASNIVNINPYIKISPIPKMQLLASVYMLSRQSEKDGIYSPGMGQTRPTRKEVLFASTAKQIGNQYAFEAAYFLNKQWSFFIDGAYFPAGELVKATGKGKAISYYSSKIAYKF